MKVVVVGASSGLGRCIGEGLGQGGADVALLARRHDRLVDAAKAAGPGSLAIACDVTDEASVTSAIAEAAAGLGGIDAVVYATGIGELGRIEEVDQASWRRVFDTNVIGASLVTAAALPHVAESHGRIAYLTSTSSHFTPPWPGLGAYAVSKAALNKMIDAWRAEHPSIGFTQVIVGECGGGEGDARVEFNEGWDMGLATEFAPIWMAREYFSGHLMEVAELVGTVDTVLRLGGTANIPSVAVLPPAPGMSTVGIVTGAASGIGAATARRLVSTVDVLILADRQAGPLDTIVGELSSPGTACEALVTDITDPDALDRLAHAASGHGTLRSVAHVAGISPTMGDWRAVLDVDLVATAQLLERLHPLAEAHTAIVCVASMAAHLIGPHADPAVDAVIDLPLATTIFDDYQRAAGDGYEDPGMAYAMAKRGVMRLVRRDAQRFGERGARICTVSPGTIDTPMGRQELEQQPGMAMLADVTPLARNGRADELAAAIAFLLSDDASYITGTDLLTDGGTCAAIAQMG